MNKHQLFPRNAAFANPDEVPGPLGPHEAAGLLVSAGDVTFVLDANGTILDCAVPHAELAERGFGDWTGRAWADTVTVESRPKVAEMLRDAASGAAARWRQVNHPTAGGDVPVRYLTVALGREGRIAAIGREMREAAAAQQRLLQTQQSLERDYVQLRQSETRFRLLFELASEPVLVVEAASRRIRDANPAAYRLLGWSEGSLAGRSASAIVDEACRDALVGHFGAAEASDTVAPVTLDLAGARGRASFSARLFRQGKAALLLLKIAPADTPVEAVGHKPTLADLVERMPDAFVLADAKRVVIAANAAFAELAGMPSADRIVGTELDEWLGRPGVDLDLITAQLREHGSVRNVATVIRGAGGKLEEVELSGVRAPGENGSDRYGFTIRGVGRRLRGRPAIERELRSVEQLTELVGRMSLKDIVRESTDLIERLCIEAALAYTEDNRASAAELLGVSRQSLYSKLHRHGLGNLGSDEESVASN